MLALNFCFPNLIIHGGYLPDIMRKSFKIKNCQFLHHVTPSKVGITKSGPTLALPCAGPWSGGLGPYPTHNSQVLWRNMMVGERELWAPAFGT
jgi:hypothetical protein